MRVKVLVLGFRARVRATSVAYCSGKLATKPAALDSVAAASTSSCVAASLPYLMLSATDPWNSTGSCVTNPSCCRSQHTLRL